MKIVFLVDYHFTRLVNGLGVRYLDPFRGSNGRAMCLVMEGKTKSKQPGRLLCEVILQIKNHDVG